MLWSPLRTQSVTTAKYVSLSGGLMSLNGRSSGATTATSAEKTWHAKDDGMCDKQWWAAVQG